MFRASRGRSKRNTATSNLTCPKGNLCQEKPVLQLVLRHQPRWGGNPTRLISYSATQTGYSRSSHDQRTGNLPNNWPSNPVEAFEGGNVSFIYLSSYTTPMTKEEATRLCLVEEKAVDKRYITVSKDWLLNNVTGWTTLISTGEDGTSTCLESIHYLSCPNCDILQGTGKIQLGDYLSDCRWCRGRNQHYATR